MVIDASHKLKSTVIPRGTDSAKVISVIETQSIKGAGTIENPTRMIFQYWGFGGNLLAVHDPLAPQEDVISLT